MGVQSSNLDISFARSQTSYPLEITDTTGVAMWRRDQERSKITIPDQNTIGDSAQIDFQFQLSPRNMDFEVPSGLGVNQDDSEYSTAKTCH